MAEAAVEGLDLSLVTDILMLSATSPWTVYIADRSQWLLCFVSASVKRTTGWTSQELLGTAAWGACHSEDVPMVQRMLHLRDTEPSGGSVIYRRLRKDRSYVTVHATGRAIGTRWYAWVEQDILNFSPVSHQEELQAKEYLEVHNLWETAPEEIDYGDNLPLPPLVHPKIRPMDHPVCRKNQVLTKHLWRNRFRHQGNSTFSSQYSCIIEFRTLAQ